LSSLILHSHYSHKDENDEEDDADEADDVEGGATSGATGGKKKKKKKKTTKKKKATSTFPGATEPKNPQHIRVLGGFTDYYVKYGQTEIPSKPVEELFPNGGCPVGEIMPHHKTKYPDPMSSYARTTDAERRYESLYFVWFFFIYLLF
jgi:hypothetical protein